MPGSSTAGPAPRSPIKPFARSASVTMGERRLLPAQVLPYNAYRVWCERCVMWVSGPADTEEDLRKVRDLHNEAHEEEYLRVR